MPGTDNPVKLADIVRTALDELGLNYKFWDSSDGSFLFPIHYTVDDYDTHLLIEHAVSYLSVRAAGEVHMKAGKVPSTEIVSAAARAGGPFPGFRVGPIPSPNMEVENYTWLADNKATQATVQKVMRDLAESQRRTFALIEKEYGAECRSRADFTA